MINRGVPRRYLEADKMENRIHIAIIALVSILISYFFAAGCSLLPGYITINSQSEVMNPTFCMYDDLYFQKRLRIESITVEKARRSFEEKKRWELDASWDAGQTVWHLEYNNFLPFYWMNCLFGWQPTSPVSSLTYGEVPRSYKEKVKALPLEPEQLYIVSMDAYEARSIMPLKFVIRLNAAGGPDRVEYLGRNALFRDIGHYLKLH